MGSGMYLKRLLDLTKTLQHKSCFLFGPRQTGKTSLIRETLGQYRSYTLLDSQDYLKLSQNPKLLEQERQDQEEIVIIDEIQRLPNLLNEVHLLIEKYNLRFLLTGSSARKLRRGGVNILGGRARSKTLHPFSYSELGGQFKLLHALKYGLLPSIYFSDSPLEDLRAYTGDYLKEEIASEALVRNISAFSRFLQIAALCNGQILNYAKISSDAQVPATTVQEYFQILRDTLLAFDLPAWKQSLKRKPITTSKFYFFDGGIARFLQHQTDLNEKTPEFGFAFEHFIMHELKTYVDYHQNQELHYWRSASGYEVDFIFDNRVAIEVKAKDWVTERDLRGIKALKEEGLLQQYCVVTMEKRPREIDGIFLYPWEPFLKKLWKGDVDSRVYK